MTVLRLPYPPSANGIWRNVNGRTLKSRAYRAWLQEALLFLRAQRLPLHQGSYHMRILVDRPDRRRRDLSNLLKATEDCLVQAGVIEDDSLAQSLSIAWSDAEAKKPGGLHICVEGC